MHVACSVCCIPRSQERKHKYSSQQTTSGPPQNSLASHVRLSGVTQPCRSFPRRQCKQLGRHRRTARPSSSKCAVTLFVSGRRILRTGIVAMRHSAIPAGTAARRSRSARRKQLALISSRGACPCQIHLCTRDVDRRRVSLRVVDLEERRASTIPHESGFAWFAKCRLTVSMTA